MNDISTLFNQVKLTYIENWPSRLHQASLPTVTFPLELAEVEIILDLALGTRQATHKERELVLNRLAAKIDSIIKRHFPRGVFVRLGSRSPKDSTVADKEGMRCLDGRKAVRLLVNSERVAADLAMAKANGYTTFVAVREWMHIEPWQEFRAFFKGRRLAGISQYHYRLGYAELQDETLLENIRRGIEKAAEELAPFFPLKKLVADFVYRLHVDGPRRIHQVYLLELDPFWSMTDPCLFDWDKDDFSEFEFRVVRGDSASKVVSFRRQ